MIPELPAWQWLLVFAGGGVLLVRAAVALASAGDQIAERTGLSRAFVGTLLLAGATSMPELLTDVSAVLADAPDLAVGDLFGSSMANMAILAILDLIHRGTVWPSVELAHARVGAVAIALTAVAALGVLTPPGLSLGWVGLDTIAVAAMYVAAVAWFRRTPVLTRAGGLLPTVPPRSRVEPKGGGPVGESVVRFAGATLLILVAAPLVAVSGREIAVQAGIAETTVGAALLAFVTSLPELVASLANVRIGAYDLAVGNLFGSNAANMSVLVLVDLAYLDGPLLAAVSPAQVVAALGAVLLMALAIAALVTGSESRIGRLEPDAVVLLLAYVGALVAVGMA